MSNEVRFTVYGEPVAKGRPRTTRKGHTYTPEKTVNYETLVKLTYSAEHRFIFPQDIPIGTQIVLYTGIPKSVSKKKREMMLSGEIRPTKKPDVDNCVKSILDALNGVAYHDDSQIVEVTASKFYSDTPRVEVIFTELNSLIENDIIKNN